MLRGNFPAKIDAQGRIKIPTAHRNPIEDKYGPELYVTSVSGENVLIYPMSEWEEIETTLLEPPKMLPEKVKFLRHTNYYGQVSTMDKQGRVLIQPHLREAAQIDGEVAVMGYLTYLQVWNIERFQDLLKAEPYTDKDAAVLAELGI
ncbi:MAG: division/cell wall cluster transcriptional repressor MraZ [Acidobacteriota bacterium]